MRELSEELSKEYEGLYDKYVKAKAVCLGFKDIPKSFDNKNIRDCVYAYLDFIAALLMQRYNKLEENADKCIKKIYKFKVNKKDKEKCLNYIVDETYDEILKLDEAINNCILKKAKCKELLDNREISDEVYKSAEKNISKEERIIFRKYMDQKVREFKPEMEKMIRKATIMKIVTAITCVLVAIAGIFLLKKIRNILVGTKKDIALTIGRKTVDAIKEGNKAKALQNTAKTAEKAKVILECVNNTKIINKDIALNI